VAQRATDPRVTFLVDDLVARKPWAVRGIEIRGRAEALVDASTTTGGDSADVIRIHPRRILSWGINAESDSTLQARDVGREPARGDRLA
jgi:pyridoxamine 5'-phosphate oxidase family protein